MNEKNIYSENDFLDKNGHLTEETVALYVEAMLYKKLNELPDFIHNHKRKCLQCNVNILELYDIMRDEIMPPVESHPFFGNKTEFNEELTAAKTGNKNWNKFIKIAAMLLIFSGIAVSLFLITKSHNDISNLSAFKKNDEFEQIINTNYRNEKIEIISPLTGENFNGNVLFKWQGTIDKKLDLEIFNNKGKSIIKFENINKDGSLQFLINKNLNPGLYYWKLITGGDIVEGGDILSAGKFTVKLNN